MIVKGLAKKDLYARYAWELYLNKCKIYDGQLFHSSMKMAYPVCHNLKPSFFFKERIRNLKSIWGELRVFGLR